MFCIRRKDGVGSLIVRVASHNNELIFFKILGFPIGPAHPSLKHACKIIPINQPGLSAPNSSSRPGELVRMIVCLLKVGKSNPRPDAHRGPLPIGCDRSHVHRSRSTTLAPASQRCVRSMRSRVRQFSALNAV